MRRTFMARVMELVEKDFGLTTNRAIAKLLRINEAALAIYKKEDPGALAMMTIVEGLLKAEIARTKQGSTHLNVAAIMRDYVQEAIGSTKQKDVAEYLGMPQAQLAGYVTQNSNGELATRRMLESLVNSQVARSIEGLITPLFEYKRITPQKTHSTYRLRLNADKEDELEPVLKGKKGVYIFYDSIGVPFYIGKAKETELYGEVCRRLGTKVIEIIGEKCKKTKLEQGSIASFLSAYEVRLSVVDTIESLLIRTCANVNQNIRMENL